MTMLMAAVAPRMFYGWWVAFASAAVILLSAGTFFYGFGLLVTPLENEFGWSRGAISIAFSLRTEVGGVAAPLVGFLVDRLGARKLMTSGIFIVAAGFIALSQVQSLLMFYGAVVLIAIGMSTTTGAVPTVVVTHWFRRMRGRALGLMALGGGLSGITAVFFAWLIESYGWRDALVITAVLQFVLVIPFVLSIRNRPQDVGLQPDGLVEDASSTDEAAVRRNVDAEGMTSKQALRSATFWRMALALGLSNFATTALVVHQVPFLTESAGMSETAAAASVTAMTFLSIIGRLGMGAATDFLPKRMVMAVSMLLVAIAAGLFITVTEPWQLIYALPFFGIGHGGMVPVRSTLQADFFGLKAFGAIQGLMLTISTFGAVLGPIIAGFMYDASDSYRLAFVMLAVAPLLGVPLILGAKQPRWRDAEVEAATSA